MHTSGVATNIFHGGTEVAGMSMDLGAEAGEGGREVYMRRGEREKEVEAYGAEAP